MARQKHEIRGETGELFTGSPRWKSSSKVVVAIQVEIKSGEQTWYTRLAIYTKGTLCTDRICTCLNPEHDYKLCERKIKIDIADKPG